jgi:hypothetical protein
MRTLAKSGKHISILTQVILALALCLSIVSPVLAIDPTAGCSNGINTGIGCIPYETKGFTASLLTFLVGTAGAISLVIMLIATVQIMTGGDNAEQVKKGKELFTGAVTGLLFIIFSVTLLRIVAGDIIQLPGF